MHVHVLLTDIPTIMTSEIIFKHHIIIVIVGIRANSNFNFAAWICFIEGLKSLGSHFFYQIEHK